MILYQRLKNFALEKPSFFSIIMFISFTAITMLIRPDIFQRYFIDQSAAFDGLQYFRVTIENYAGKGQTAFYPLWPTLLVPYKYIFGAENLFLPSALTAFGFFIGSIFVFKKVLQSYFSKEIVLYCLLLYTLNPNSVFHARPYAESLFCFLTAIFLLLIIKQFKSPKNSTLIGIFSTCFFISLTRPILLQSIGAFFFTLGILFFMRIEKITSHLKIALTTLLGLIIGYLPYGFFCLAKHNSFFAPFEVQANWGRKLGIYWELLTSPKSVSSSDNILTWDIQGFYLPTILLITTLFIVLKQMKKSDGVENSDLLKSQNLFVFWFAIFFAAAHSGAAFLTYPIFMSLARHVFSNPFIYIGIGFTLSLIKASKTKSFVMGFYLFASIIYFGNYWARFAKGSWMG